MKTAGCLYVMVSSQGNWNSMISQFHQRECIAKIMNGKEIMGGKSQFLICGLLYEIHKPKQKEEFKASDPSAWCLQVISLLALSDSSISCMT